MTAVTAINAAATMSCRGSCSILIIPAACLPLSLHARVRPASADQPPGLHGSQSAVRLHRWSVIRGWRSVIGVDERRQIGGRSLAMLLAGSGDACQRQVTVWLQPTR